MDIPKKYMMDKKQVQENIEFVKQYLSTRKGLIYIVHYAFAQQKDGEAFLHMPSNTVICTGNIEEAIASFFMLMSTTRNIAKNRMQQEIQTAITGELLSTALDIPALYDRAKDEVIPLLVSMLETQSKDAVATVVLQVTTPLSPMKTEDDEFAFGNYDGIVN